MITILVVAYALVPFVSGFFHSTAGYNPAYYEPKDVSRIDWLTARGPLPVGGVTGDAVFKMVLFACVGLLWVVVIRARR